MRTASLILYRLIALTLIPTTLCAQMPLIRPEWSLMPLSMRAGRLFDRILSLGSGLGMVSWVYLGKVLDECPWPGGFADRRVTLVG
jgi:hypothetical protein